MKSLKKAIRKASAINRSPACPRHMRTYLKYFRLKEDFDGPQSWYRHVLIWTQTRATGLADGSMTRDSVLKFIRTVTTPVKEYRWLAEQDFTQSLTDIVNLIQRDAPLPDRVVKRLNLFMESDN